MRTFECDYTEGVHPKLLEALTRTNMEQMSGYGCDPYTARAAEKIKAACGFEDATVTFFAGGTQTNMIVIDLLLASFEGVISPKTWHINVHEAGAIEFTGHKVLSLPAHEGKLDAAEVRQYLEAFHSDVTCDHMVFPGMVYVSHPTEPGTLYSKAELEALADVFHVERASCF